MGSAKVIIKEQIRGDVVPSMDGIFAGIVVRAGKGDINVPRLTTSVSEYLDVYGDPDPRFPETYSALTMLSENGKVWVVRAATDDTKYAGVLVRGKTISIDTTNPFAKWNDEAMVVKPLDDGIPYKKLESFEFPLYLGNRTYAKENIEMKSPLKMGKLVVDTFGTLQVGDKFSIVSNSLTEDELNDPNNNVGESLPYYTIVDLKTEKVEYDLVTLDDAVTVTKGTVIKDKDGNPIKGNPTVMANAENSKQILVDNADYLTPTMEIKIGDQTTTVKQKDKLTVDENVIYVDNIKAEVDTIGKNLMKITHYEFEERDSFLVVEESAGAWGNGKISIGIAPSKNYEEAFNILVYDEGVLVETWEVTKHDFIDGNDNQLYLEDRINGKSKYIKVIDNRNFENNPLYTDHSYWRQLPEDVFISTGIHLAENVLRGHKQVLLSSVDGLSIGDRVKFVYDVNIGGSPVYSKEYKISSIDSANNYIILDRPVEEYEIARTYEDLEGNTKQTELYKFDASYNNADEGIYHGVRYYPITKLDRVFYNYPIGKTFVIGDKVGKLLDAGVNLMNGGSDGSPVTLAEMLNALYTLENREKTPVVLLCDGGYTHPAYAQAMVEIAEKQDETHCYLSIDPNAEDSNNWKQDVVDYVASLNLNTEKASVFAGWVKIYDRYNKKYVWTPPSAFAIVAQTITHKDYYDWYPAAGWERGRIRVLESKIVPSEPERDWLIDNRINPLKYSSDKGFAIWGNRTLFSKPSPLTQRSVAILLIVIKHGLREMLEYKEFDFNDERTWVETERAIDKFLMDIKSKRGLYKYKVAVKDVISGQDINNQRMPIFVGIQPTSSIKEIPVTLATYPYGVEIKAEL